MKERTVKSAVTNCLLYSEWALFALTLILFLRGGFTIDEFKSIIEILGPMMISRTAIVFRHLVGTRNVTYNGGSQVSLEFGIAAILVCLLLVLTIAGLIFQQAYHYYSIPFGDFIESIAATETVFGGLVGFLLRKLFRE